ncbi:MAG: hypothetical protein ABII82_12185 [Verrucomicrobiota bacterium]
MRRRSVVFRESPRFAPERRAQLFAASRPILRTTVIFGPLLSLVAWWMIHRFAPEMADQANRIIWLFVAPFALALALMMPILLMHVRILERHFLNTWRLTSHGVVEQSAWGARGFAWKSITSFRTDTNGDEINIHIDTEHLGKTFKASIACLRSEVSDADLNAFREAVANGHLRS